MRLSWSRKRDTALSISYCTETTAARIADMLQSDTACDSAGDLTSSRTERKSAERTSSPSKRAKSRSALPSLTPESSAAVLNMYRKPLISLTAPYISSGLSEKIPSGSSRAISSGMPSSICSYSSP